MGIYPAVNTPKALPVFFYPVHLIPVYLKPNHRARNCYDTTNFEFFWFKLSCLHGTAQKLNST
jgi:hypothetical protein